MAEIPDKHRMNCPDPEGCKHFKAEQALRRENEKLKRKIGIVPFNADVFKGVKIIPSELVSKGSIVVNKEDYKEALTEQQ